MDKESTKDVVTVPAEAGRSRRRPGRPAGDRQAAIGREPLLEAALGLFARKGIAETPLSAVAAEVGVSKAMLHYHFRTREHLLDVIVQERLLPMRREVVAGVLEQDDPVAALVLMARRLIGQAMGHAWLAPLWVREVLSEGGLLRARMHQQLAEVDRTTLPLARWQAEGKLNPALQPELILLSLLGLVLLPLAVAPAPGAPFSRPLDEAVLIRHVTALLGQGIPG